MEQRFEIDGVSVAISSAPPAAPRKRPAYARPAEDDLEGIAAWQMKTVPTTMRTVAEHLALWFGDNCALCLHPVDMELRHPHPGSANVDHIEPKSDGGSNTWGNVRLAHRSCNMQRSNLVLPEPTARQYAALLAEATTKFLYPDSFKPSAIWVARDTAAFMVASRAMMLKMVAQDVERGTDDGFTAKTRAELAVADARVEKALAKVLTLQTEATLRS